jgi:zinc/manganese transport system ATP-binding protein
MAKRNADPATAEAASTLISAESLTVGYGGTPIWTDGNFSFGKGEFVAVLGPNGAGKTTLFRVLLGLLRPMSGTVRIFGAPPSRGNPHIGYVPQRHTVDTDTNVECLELVRLGLSGTHWGLGLESHVDREAAWEALGASGASDLAHHRLGALSGGELQRVFLAEALVSSPEVLLLDEPLSNLDIRRETELLHLVNHVVRDGGVTALLIAHNVNPLLPHVNKVMYVANGRVAIGKPSEVLTSESLSRLYGIPVEVLQDPHGNVAIIGVEEHHGDVP